MLLVRQNRRNRGCFKWCRWCDYPAPRATNTVCGICGISYAPDAKPASWRHRVQLWRVRQTLWVYDHINTPLDYWSQRHPRLYPLALAAAALVIYGVIAFVNGWL